MAVDNLADNFGIQTYLDIRDQINAGEPHEAILRLATLSPVKTFEKRWHQHMLGFALMRSDRLKEAHETLLRAYQEFGPHVSLLADLYQTAQLCHDAASANRYLEVLQKELQHSFEILSPAQRTRSFISLGKAYEDQGRLSEAIHFFEQAVQASTGPLHLRALAQIVRIKAMYGSMKGLGEFYRLLLQKDHEAIPLNLRNEIEHALCLAEALVISPETSWQRVLIIFQNPLSSMTDRRLTYFDYVEILLRLKVSIPDEVRSYLSRVQDLDKYEEILLSFMNQTQDLISEIQWTYLVSKIEMACYLRLIHLRLLYESTEEAKSFLKRKLALLLEGFDAKTLDLWNSYLLALQSSTRVILTLDRKTLSATSGSKMLSLRNKSSSFELLAALSRTPDLDLEEAVQLLWKTTLDTTTYDRLRILVSRLNKSLLELTGERRLIQFSSQGLKLLATTHLFE